MPTALSTFLNTAGAMHAREEMLMHRLLDDVKLAAARREYHLITYRSDVDHDGFDVIFDDRQMLRKFQVKTVLGGTNFWNIHKRLLRPEMYSADNFGFESSTTGIGQEGGVILMKTTEQPDGQLTVEYGYTDLHILTAIELDIIPRHPNAKNGVDRVMADLRRNTTPSDRVEVGVGGFVMSRGVDELLALAGVQSTSDGQWRYNLMKISAANLGMEREQQEGAIESLRKFIADELVQLTN